MAEDQVQYWIYPTEEGMDALSTLARVWELIDDLVNKYIWHLNIFNLSIQNDKDGWHLEGKVDYGESVEDEWMVISLLVHITKKLDNLCARVVDTDGEILLIEAANTLPRWAGEPDIADGRVFLYGGQVHLLAPCKTPGDISPFPHGRPNPSSAARYIATYPHLTQAGQPVQKAIIDRIGGLPKDVSSNLHTTTVVIPDILAALLHNNHQAVSDIVHALRDQDHLDMRKTRSMPRIKQTKTGSYALTFPRCLYALLSSINVRPHRSCKWSIDEKDRGQVLGFKLSLGLEIILSRYRPPHQTNSEDEGCSAEFAKFCKSLAAVGYFQDELEGSIKHRQLTAKAREFWQNSLNSSSTETADFPTHSRLDRLVSTIQKYEENQLPAPPAGWLTPGGRMDDETWMEVTPESLDRLLASRFGVAEGGQENIPGHLNDFLKKISDMAGVGGGSSGPNDDGNLDFDPNQLLSSMQKLLGENGGGQSGGDFDLGGAENESDLDTSDEDDEEAGGEEDPVITDYMNRLDAEVGEAVKGRPDDVLDPDRPLDVDASVLSNLLASYSSEFGISGPTSSLLTSIGINPGREPKS